MPRLIASPSEAGVYTNIIVSSMYILYVFFMIIKESFHQKNKNKKKTLDT